LVQQQPSTPYSDAFDINSLGARNEVCESAKAVHDDKNEILAVVVRERASEIEGNRFPRCFGYRECVRCPFWEQGRVLVELAEVAAAAEIDEVFAHREPIDMVFGKEVAFVGAKVRKFCVD
jgi:hypothetical protein